MVDFHYVPHVFVLPPSPHSIRQPMSDNNDETLTSEEEEKLRGLLESRRRLGLHMNVLIFQAHFERNRWTAVKRACGQRQRDEIHTKVGELETRFDEFFDRFVRVVNVVGSEFPRCVLPFYLYHTASLCLS